eukprot:766649-Hanusia_phi.AAC.3
MDDDMFCNPVVSALSLFSEQLIHGSEARIWDVSFVYEGTDTRACCSAQKDYNIVVGQGVVHSKSRTRRLELSRQGFLLYGFEFKHHLHISIKVQSRGLSLRRFADVLSYSCRSACGSVSPNAAKQLIGVNCPLLLHLLPFDASGQRGKVKGRRASKGKALKLHAGAVLLCLRQEMSVLPVDWRGAEEMRRWRARRKGGEMRIDHGGQGE